MNKEETTKILAILKTAFPNSYKNLTETDARGMISVWEMNFSDIPADIVLIALYKTISVSVFPPTIADIRNKFRSIFIESQVERAALNPNSAAYNKYNRICEILEPYYFTRNCPELKLCDILRNLSAETSGGQIGAKAGEIDALPNEKGGNN